MGNIFDDELVARIYEAAVLPDLWPSVLDDLARAVDCQVGFLFAVDGASAPRSVVNDRGQEAARKFFSEGWASRNTQGARTLSRDEPKFISDFDIYTAEEIAADPYYREFLRPNGLAWGCGTVISGPVPNRIMVSIHRPYEMGPMDQASVERLTRLRPMIARAAFMTARLKLERAQTAVATLELMGLPGAALSRSGKIQAANALFEKQFPRIATDGASRMRLLSAEADRLLSQALEQPRVFLQGCTIPVPRTAESSATIIHLIPVRGSAHDLFSNVDWIVVAIEVKAAPAVDSMILQGLFDLTPAEARVAKGLVAGLVLEEIAASVGISKETVRSQLKSAMAKTGVRRQAELVGLLSGAGRRYGVEPE